jgi:hypothetical protein
VNLFELADTLPNGFHDAGLRRFTMDYVRRTLDLEMDVWVGDMDDPSRREAYRPARVTVTRVAYLVTEPPDARYPWLKPGSLTIDTGTGRPGTSSIALPEAPPDMVAGYIWIGEFNAFFHLAAESAELEWTGPEVVDETGAGD